MKKGHSFKDYICPDTFEFSDDSFYVWRASMEEYYS